MALYKRGPFWWIRKDPVTGVRRSSQCRDKKAALLYEAERERLAADPAYAASHSATVGGWADKVMAKKRATKAEGTADMYRVKLGHVVRIFGRTAKLADVTPKNVDAYIEQRTAEGAVPNTIGKELTALVQICKAARRAGEFAGDIDALRPNDFSIEYKPRERVLTAAELVALIAALSKKKAAALALAVATGGRHSELARITPAHVDTVRWLVHIPGTKTAAANRTIPIAEPFRRLLLAALPLLPVSWPRMSKDLTELAAELQMAPVTANDLRRTTASWLIEAGVAHGIVSSVLGHKGPQMVHRVYGRATPEALGEVIARQISAGTPVSQSAPDGSVCDGLVAYGFSCDSSAVAPERLELSQPEGSGILSPNRHGDRGGDSEESSAFPGTERPPHSAESRGSRTQASHAMAFRRLSRKWFTAREAA